MSSMARRVGYVFDSVMEAHRGGMGHPERPSRIRAIHERLQDRGLLERMMVLPSRFATEEELLLVHPRVHVDRVMQFAEEGALQSALDGGEDSEGPYNPSSEGESEVMNYVVAPRSTEKNYIFPFGADTYVCKESPAAAKASAGCVLALVEEIVDKDSPVDRGFACVRPPGHHATCSEAMGFCFFNNVAIAAKALRERYGVERVAIVDWDVHHGNGTCGIFEEDSGVLVISVHRFDGGTFYPGSGNWTEMGSGDAVGYTLNVPIDGTYGDEELHFCFDKLVLPALTSFKPEFILVSCGFDACINDPLGECEVTPACYGRLTRQLIESFPEGSAPRVALVLEGGYNLDSIAASAEECMRALLEDDGIDGDGGVERLDNEVVEGSSPTRLRSVPLGEPKTSLIRTLHNLTSCLAALPGTMDIPIVPLPRRAAQRQSPGKRTPNRKKRSSSFKLDTSPTTLDMTEKEAPEGSDTSVPGSGNEIAVVSGGGHAGGITRDPERDGYIIKKTKTKEAEFYSLLFSLVADPPLVIPSITERQKDLLEKLKPLVPSCIRVQRFSEDKKSSYRIWLEDLTRGMREPCVIDVKLGDKYWQNDYTGAKLQEKLDKVRESSAGELAVRLTALCTNGAAGGPGGGQWNLSKKECADLRTTAEIITALRRFIWIDREALGRQAVAITKGILEWFEEANGAFEIVCSSVLLAFDAADEKLQMRGKLIDFAHVDYSGAVGDAGVVRGLRNLVDYWQCASQD